MSSPVREKGVVLAELLLLLVLLGAIFSWAMPAILRVYRYGAVRFEAEHLLGELRREQMAARTAAQKMGSDGSTVVSDARPKLLLTGNGYIIYRGRYEVRRHNCLSSVQLKFNNSLDGTQALYVSANGNVSPNVTVTVFASGRENIRCNLVIDPVGRLRLERDDTGG